MSSYDKLIKGATKPKPGAPKAKYIDPIIAASFANDGSLQDVCKSIGARLREPNSLVVFKSLLVLHTMIRNGGVQNVLDYLAGPGNLKLRNVAQGGNWQGYDAPRALAPYAAYLDERIKAYGSLRRDVIREADTARTNGGSGGAGANRLRRLTIEKGLLRETGVTQGVLGRALDCPFFQDSLSDEMNVTAFRMTLKDLLSIYAAINEGVINILEQYFALSKPDAERALEIYKRFCRHTEKFVAYLSSAKKASSVLNVPIPNLRHAPVSLAGALKEYLEDENFEKNRKEYAENMKAVRDGRPPPAKTQEKKGDAKKITIQEPSAEEKVKPPKPASSSQALQDFFESLESDQQQNVFSNQPGPSAIGPWGQQPGMMQGQMTGMPMGGAGPFSFMAPQPTGMPMGMNAFGDGGGLQPQMTGYNPFMQQQQQAAQQQQAFLSAQSTAFMQPQMTGFNPFRQSVMMAPQATGFPGQQQQQQPFQSSMLPPGLTNPLQAQQQQQNGQAQQGQGGEQPAQQQQNGQAQSNSPFPQASGAAGQTSFNNAFGNGASSGAGASGSTLSATPKPLIAQKTGSRNPFAPPPGSTPPPSPPPPGSQGPTLAQLAMGAFGPQVTNGGHYGLGAAGWDGTDPTKPGQGPVPGTQAAQQQQQGQSVLQPQKTGLIGSIASEFAFSQPGGANANGASTPTPAQSGPSQANGASSSAPTNALSTPFSSMSLGGAASGAPPSAIQPQPTGFAGSLVKPFKPESSFGAQLASQPQFAGAFSNGTSTPGASAQPTASSNPFGSVGSGFGQAQAQAQANQAQPQQAQQATATGVAGGGFGASLFPSQQQQQPQQAAHGLTAQPTGFAGSSIKPFQPSSAFGTAAFGGTANGAGAASTSPFGQAQPQQQQQQQQQQPQTTFGTLF